MRDESGGYRKIMKKIEISFYILFVMSFVLGSIGFLLSKLWYAEIVFIVYSVLWVFLRKKAPTLFLFLSVLIASVGLLLKAQSLCMILYSGLILVCWDLTKTELLLVGYVPDRHIKLYIDVRLRSLAAVMSVGVCLVLISGYIHFQIPFLLLIVLAVAAFFCIGKIVLFLNNKQ